MEHFRRALLSSGSFETHTGMSSYPLPCRFNQSDCFTKDHPYYWTTCMGLNTLVGPLFRQVDHAWVWLPRHDVYRT